MLRACWVRPSALAVVAMGSILALTATAQKPGQIKTPKLLPSSNPVVEGVITRVEQEKSVDGRTSGKVHVTINSAIVWRDFARDTATEDGQKPAEAAKAGDQSVATKGQPEDQNTIATIEVPTGIPLELRYRSQMDGRSKGAASAEKARDLVRRDPVADQAKTKSSADPAPSDDGGPGKSLTADDLKQGLWVSIECRKGDESHVARHVIVLEPISDVSTTASPRDEPKSP